MFEVNLLAVLVSGLAYMAIGFLWYGILLRKPWMKLSGMSEDYEMSSGDAAKTYGGSFHSSLLMALVLAYIVGSFDAQTALSGAGIGLLTGFGFVATTQLTNYLYSVKPKSWGLYFIDTGYFVVALAIMGAILAAW